MAKLPNCPQCDSEYTYQDGNLLTCPMCHHSWTVEEQEAAEEAAIIRDANGNELADGDSGSIIDDVRVSNTERLRRGDRVTNIRLLDQPRDGHDIEGTVEGFGRMYLKSQIIRKQG